MLPVIRVGICALFCVSSVAAMAQSYEDVVRDRFGSHATVCVEGEPCASSVVGTAPLQQAPGGGGSPSQATYNTGCAACHNIGLAGAPKFGDKASWGPRADLPLEALFSSVKNGKGGMPPKGLCQTCTDDELRGAVEYMLAELK